MRDRPVWREIRRQIARRDAIDHAIRGHPGQHAIRHALAKWGQNSCRAQHNVRDQCDSDSHPHACQHSQNAAAQLPLRSNLRRDWTHDVQPSSTMTPTELAAKTTPTERYVREWLNANAASGYITYDAAAKTYELPPEQAMALTAIDLPGAFHIVSACFKDEPK